MATCITQDVKSMLATLLAKEIPVAVLATVIDAIPSCESMGLGKAVAVAQTKRETENWPDAVLHDEKGEEVAGSLSGLFKDTFGVPVTEDLVCRITREGQPDCRAISAVENWQNRGYIVKGDGEASPVVEKGQSTGDIDRMYKNWKSKLLSENKVINIYHPKSPEVEIKKPRKGK
jgi:hypothetical protein